MVTKAVKYRQEFKRDGRDELEANLGFMASRVKWTRTNSRDLL